MKKLILTLAVATTLISCNKVDRPCNCVMTTQETYQGNWVYITDESLRPIEIDTLVDCSLDNQITYLEEYNNERRQIIRCK